MLIYQIGEYLLLLEIAPRFQKNFNSLEIQYQSLQKGMYTYLDTFKGSEYYQLELKNTPQGKAAPFDNFFKIVIFFYNLWENRKLFWNQHEKLNILAILHVHKVQF